LEELPYFRDCQIKRAKETEANFSQADSLLRAKNTKIYKGSVLEHLLVQTIVQFFNVGKHNIIRLENADWNDGLDMAAQNGESVVFTFMYAHNLENLCALLEELKRKTKNVYLLKELKILLDNLNKPVDYDSFREKQKRLEEYFRQTTTISGEKIKVDIDELISDLKAKSKHMSRWLKKKEWLKSGFFNGYYDNKLKRVEGNINGKTRMMLSSQVFAIMSGVAENDQIKKIWSSIKKYLYDKKHGGFRLNTDFGSLYLDLGRAFGFSYGDKENGAFFSHMSVMLANALYKRGFVNEGFEVINSLYRMAISENAKIYPLLPEYFNSQGRGLYLYLTGSASWYIYTLLEEALGIKFNYGDLVIEPKLLPSNFSGNNIETLFTLESKQIKVNFIRAAGRKEHYKIKDVFLNGKKIIREEGKYLIKRKSLLKKNKNNIIKVCLY
jgi:cellobiose phosphorylase